MLKYIFFVSLLSLSSATLIIQPNQLYEVDLNEYYDSSINIKLEIKENEVWTTHNSNNHDYLSIILDPINSKFEWYVPYSLTKYWNNDTRLMITDLHNPNIEYINFNFEGFKIDIIPDLYNYDSYDFSWSTNSNKDYQIKLENNNKSFDLGIIPNPKTRCFVGTVTAR